MSRVLLEGEVFSIDEKLPCPEDKFAMEEALANIQLEGLSVSQELQDRVAESLTNGTFDPAVLLKKYMGDDL